MLNCTSRKQVEKVFPAFIERYDTPDKLLKEDPEKIKELIAPLGFKNRRTERLYRLAGVYRSEWNDPRELPGVGEYAARAYEMFCNNRIGELCPGDGALKIYWNWRIREKERKRTKTRLQVP